MAHEHADLGSAAVIGVGRRGHGAALADAAAVHAAVDQERVRDLTLDAIEESFKLHVISLWSFGCGTTALSRSARRRACERGSDAYTPGASQCAEVEVCRHVDGAVYLIIIGLVVGIVFWLMDYLPVPEPLNRFIKVAAILIGLVALIMVLLDVTGTDVGLGGPDHGRRLQRPLVPAHD